MSEDENVYNTQKCKSTLRHLQYIIPTQYIFVPNNRFPKNVLSLCPVDIISFFKRKFPLEFITTRHKWWALCAKADRLSLSEKPHHVRQMMEVNQVNAPGECMCQTVSARAFINLIDECVVVVSCPTLADSVEGEDEGKRTKRFPMKQETVLPVLATT